uniref:Putative ovule protein n=1 Tax=Solanum chacoense TaxID=4108 RepID=A0A0V0IEN7_SOLCH
MDVPVKKPQVNGPKTLISDDILAKRLKNRERQRRYRERKRLKADNMKVLGTNQLVSLPVGVPMIVSPRDSTLLVNVAPLDSSVPVEVAPLDSSMPVNVAPRAYVKPVDVSSRESVTRVYSGRNWKRDARKAHVARQNEVSTSNMVSSDLASTGGGQATLLPHVEQSDIAMSNVISSPVTASENNGTPKSIPSRRNWKAEARNKKS